MSGYKRVAIPGLKLRLATCAFALSGLLAGCANLGTPLAPPIQPAPSSAHQETIDLAGRLSVRYQKNGREEALHGSFTWSQRPGRTIVTLVSPLGQILATIDVAPGSSSLIQAGQTPRSAADVDTLAAETLGWPLPVSGLRNWLQGFARDSTGHPFIARPQAEPTAVSTPDGWRIHYISWDEEGHPKRIDLMHSTMHAGEVAIRIFIDSRQAHRITRNNDIQSE